MNSSVETKIAKVLGLTIGAVAVAGIVWGLIHVCLGHYHVTGLWN